MVMNMEYVNLYTRQHENSLYELKKKGVVRNKRLYVMAHMKDISKYFLEKYDIFVEMASEIVHKDNEISYPIWCSVSKANCLKPIDKEVVYAITVPKDKVIYFDGGKWDLVLNNQYIAKDEKDLARFEKELLKRGIDHSFNIFERKYDGMFDEIREEIAKSWRRIFEITNRSEFVVQANLWQIKKEWVKHIIYPGDDFFSIVSDMDETWTNK